jgi:hypothetical protein
MNFLNGFIYRRAKAKRPYSNTKPDMDPFKTFMDMDPDLRRVENLRIWRFR